MTPSAAQLRAARAWLRLSRAQVAHLARINDTTMERVETGAASVRPRTVAKVIAVYRAQGFVFTEAPGLERRSA